MRKMAIYISVLLLAVISIASTLTFAYFQTTKKITGEISKKDYEVELIVKFNGIEVDKTGPYYDNDKKSYIVNASNDTKENYIKNLAVSIKVTSKTATRFRVSIEDAWVNNRRYVSTGDITETVRAKRPNSSGVVEEKFETATDYFQRSDLMSDVWFYNKNIANKEIPIVTDFITGGNKIDAQISTVYVETILVYFDLSVSVVQANRFHERWNVPTNIYD